MEGATMITDGERLDGSAMPGIMERAQALVGRHIQSIGYENDNGTLWPTIILDDGTKIQGLRDDEGNGPGVLTFGSDGLWGTGLA